MIAITIDPLEGYTLSGSERWNVPFSCGERGLGLPTLLGWRSHGDMTNPTAVLMKDIRLALGLTQRAFAQKMACTTRTAGRWELGRTEPTPSTVRRALAILRARDPDAADHLSVNAQLPSAVAQEDARRAALDHAVYVAADALDVSPRRARDVLTMFVTHLVAAGLTATDARTRLAERVQADRNAAEKSAPGEL